MSVLIQHRRGFLCGLASLPLIGGGVTLLGQPTAAAVLVTDELRRSYIAFLAHEHRMAVFEWMIRDDPPTRHRSLSDVPMH